METRSTNEAIGDVLRAFGDPTETRALRIVLNLIADCLEVEAENVRLRAAVVRLGGDPDLGSRRATSRLYM